MKRICLFAGFDKRGLIQDYAINYIKSLSTLADVYYIADCPMNNNELSKISPYVKKSFAYRHNKYDFGSWQELIKSIGWDELIKYDELILANDSCYGPLFPLKTIFETMEQKDCDFWGITDNFEHNYHLQSYFLVFNNKIIKNEAFRAFFDRIKIETYFMDIVKNNEIKLTPLLIEQGFKSESLIKTTIKTNISCYPKTLIKKYNCPFIKIKCFSNSEENLKNFFEDWRTILTKNTVYDVNLIENHMKTNNNDYDSNIIKSYNNILSLKLSKIVSYLIQIKITNKHKLLIKIFRIPVLSIKLKYNK